MSEPRTLPLYDPSSVPASWSERMAPDEYAVLYSSQNLCTIVDSLAEAEQYAADYVAHSPEVRCRIYDHHGLGKPPLREIAGSAYKAPSDIGPGFRRWLGSSLFLGGLILIVIDAVAGFSLIWPATIGVRLLPVGVVLLITELVLVLGARQKRNRGHSEG